MVSLQQQFQKSKSRNIAFIAIFGTIWGIIEVSIGTYLHIFRFPFTGALMSSLSLLIILSGSVFIDEKLAIIKIGAVACFVRIFSVGSIIISPLISMAIEAIIANVIILIFSKNVFSFILAGITIVTYTFFHKFIAQGILFGKGIFKMYIDVLNESSKILGIDIHYAFLIIFLLILLHIILGIITGISAFYLANQAKKRLGYK
jgi:hypothetical protein